MATEAETIRGVGASGARDRAVTLLSTITVFLGAGLLFLVQPMMAKLVLPYFGGSPTVWNTCASVLPGVPLLAGLPLRAPEHPPPRPHAASRGSTPRASPAAAPPGPAAGWGCRTTRRLWIPAPSPRCGCCGCCSWPLFGLPFLLARDGPGRCCSGGSRGRVHRRSEDPYFLYAASNAGGVVGLLGYPFLIEPEAVARRRSRSVVGRVRGFVVLVGCASDAMRGPRARSAGEAASVAATAAACVGRER